MEIQRNFIDDTVEARRAGKWVRFDPQTRSILEYRVDGEEVDLTETWHAREASWLMEMAMHRTIIK
jgi:hypothetical protein